MKIEEIVLKGKYCDDVIAAKVLKDGIYLTSMIPNIEDGMEFNRVFVYWDEWDRIIDFIDEYRK